MKLIIPTHNRSKTITTPYLEVFKNYDVTLLVHDEEQYIAYKKLHNFNIVNTKTNEGKNGQTKYAIENLVEHDEWVVFADDNIDYIYGLNNKLSKYLTYPNKNKDDWGEIDSVQFKKRTEDLIRQAEKINAHLIGFLTTDNYFFANKKYKQYGFCHGKLTLWHKDKNFKFENMFALALDDFHNTARHLVEYGVVLINDYMHPKAKYFQAGGIGGKTARKEIRKRDIRILKVLYPNLIVDKPRPDNYPDVRIVNFSPKNFMLWRKKYRHYTNNYKYSLKQNRWIKNG